MLGSYPFRKWLLAAAGQHPGVPGSWELGWCWGSCAEPGASAQGLPGWGTGENPLEGGLGGWEGREAGKSRHTRVPPSGMCMCGRELKEEVKMERPDQCASIQNLSGGRAWAGVLAGQ